MSTRRPYPGAGRLGAAKFRSLPPLSLYIHMPWCVRKCPYCDFNSHGVRGVVPENEYVDALVRDLESALPLIWGRKVYSVFFGGGTPSLFAGGSVEQILTSVRMLLPLSLDAEISLEANPGSVEAARFAAYKAAGVNRLSMGIQSFNDDHLRALGRIHSSAEAKRAIGIAREHFDNINLDLMYGLPGQTLKQAHDDLQAALSFSPQHMSCYHLTLEPDTPFYVDPPVLPDEDTSTDMQQQLDEILGAKGFEHYETSAYAQPNQRCRHNLNYWQFGDYLGIGAGAHSKLTFHDRVVRQARHKHPKLYIQQVAVGEQVQTENVVATNELGLEFMMNALRLNGGFDSKLFQDRTGLSLDQIQSALDKAQQRGFLSRECARIAPTALGQRFLNNLLEIFVSEEMR
jgi:putative oxygen-independent coproporphyrinogen III oxidase